MTIIVNGERLEVEKEVANVTQLVEKLRLKNKSLIIEHNENILKKDQHEHATISEGDRFEIVHFVGGG